MVQDDGVGGTKPVPSCHRPRSLSIHVESPRAIDVTMNNANSKDDEHGTDEEDENGELNNLMMPDQIKRSMSLGSLPLRIRERQQDPQFRITYQDDALCKMSIENIRRLLRAAKTIDDRDSSFIPTKSDNSIKFAKKALRYRRLLRRAQSINLDDPNFDINAFLGVTWCKAEPETKN